MMKQERAKATRAELLQAAGEAFSQLTYTDAKLTDVLARTKVGKGALYFHFSSKQELAWAVIKTGREQLSETAMQALARSGTPQERLLELVDSIAKLLVSSDIARGALTLSMQRAPELAEVAVDPFRLWQPIVHGLLATALVEGQLVEGVNLDTLTTIIISCFMGLKELCTLQDNMPSLPGKVTDAMNGILSTNFK